MTNKVGTLAKLVQKKSKASAIRSFIEQSKDSEKLNKIYRKLTDNDLNKVVLRFNFKSSYYGNDAYFGQCLFETIY